MGTMTIGSKGKMILACAPGASKGANYLQNYRASAPSWLDYNYLLLHYTVDGLHSRVKEMFYGAGDPGKPVFFRDTPEWMKLHHRSKKTQEGWWNTLSNDAANPETYGTPTADGAPSGGMLRAATKRHYEVGLRPYSKERVAAMRPAGMTDEEFKKFKGPPDHTFIDDVTLDMKWNPRFVSASLNPTKWKTSDYGAFVAVDPYAPTG